MAYIQVNSSGQSEQIFSGTPGDDIFIISPYDHEFPLINTGWNDNSSEGNDVFQLALEAGIDTHNRTPHDYGEGGGTPLIHNFRTANDKVILPNGVSFSDIALHNVIGEFSPENYHLEVEIAVDPHKLRPLISGMGSKYGMGRYEGGSVFVGGSVNESEGINNLYGHPSSINGYLARLEDPTGYQEYGNKISSLLASSRANAMYEVDDIGQFLIVDSNDVKDFMKAVFDENGMSLYDYAYNLNETLLVEVPGWSRDLALNAKITSNDPEINGTQLVYIEGVLPSSQEINITGSSLTGGDGANRIFALAGWDIIDAGAGNDSVRGGNGRDVITGGAGSDELWGDFGWNTYLANDDGAKDLLVIKSDQLLENWWYGKSGNNPNGEKADVITELDTFDRIKILGANTDKITIDQASGHGLSGLGIYADGYLEAIYTGSNLTADQLSGLVSGDASSAVMNNTQGFYGV